MKKEIYPNFSLEEGFYQNGQKGIVIGVDEVGRGALAGPVVAGAFYFTYPFFPEEVADFNDSKKLSPKKRKKLCHDIQELQKKGKCDFAIAECSVEEIDEINILQASLRAMSRAVEILRKQNKNQEFLGILVDGTKLPRIGGLHCPVRCIPKGDAKSFTIAGASIVAKVARDRLMHALSKNFSGYGWERNAGYGTKEHMSAIKSFGITPHHRLSFSWQKAFDH